jgi:predicted component of type VI protein secretion system
MIKLKDRHFDTIEVIEAELQAVLNTQRNGFQDAFKKTAEVLGSVRT